MNFGWNSILVQEVSPLREVLLLMIVGVRCLWLVTCNLIYTNMVLYECDMACMNLKVYS